MGHVTVTKPLSVTVCHWWAVTISDQAVYQIKNLYVHSLQKATNIAEIWVV